jgi:hypothetical protein
MIVFGRRVWLPAPAGSTGGPSWRTPAERKLWPVRWWVWPIGTLSGLTLAILFAIPLLPLILFFNWLLAGVK